jgi:hypothetical protein
MTIEGVEALIAFMQKFKSENSQWCKFYLKFLL